MYEKLWAPADLEGLMILRL